jgi:phosphopantetheinyl transferase (holo-ACP synthase)
MRRLLHFFTAPERAYCASRHGRADRWLGHLAAKHAVARRLVADGIAAHPSDVEIRHTRAGAPYAALLTEGGGSAGHVHLTMAHTRCGGVAIAGGGGGIGVDLVEPSRFVRLTPAERVSAQRRLVGDGDGRELDAVDLQWIAGAKEAIGKAVRARECGLSWRDATLAADEDGFCGSQDLSTVWGDTDLGGPWRSGRYEVAGMTGQWACWLLEDGSNLAVAVR